MSNTIKNMTLSCTPINDSFTFTSGDYVSGEITLELVKECKIESLSVKFKGKSVVLWTERHGRATVSYYSKDKYFSIPQFFIRQGEHQIDSSGHTHSNVVTPGCHVYPFTFQFPEREMPSAYLGVSGKILYTLEARLSRSMRMAGTASLQLNFVSTPDMSSVPELMSPQYATKTKKMLFTSGTVSMDVNLERMGYYQGEGMKVMVAIHNNCTREVTPKYTVYLKSSFFAKGERRLVTGDLVKEVGEPVPASTNQTVTKIITIPPYIEPSIHNCSNIKLEHRLRVFLDVKYASNPEIKFPIIILRAESQAPAVQQPPTYSGFGSGASANPNQPELSDPPQYPAVASRPAESPPPYGAHGMYPSASGFGSETTL